MRYKSLRFLAGDRLRGRLRFGWPMGITKKRCSGPGVLTTDVELGMFNVIANKKNSCRGGPY